MITAAWPLTPDSLVVEVGAYEGAWSCAVALRYGCTVHAIEPATKARTVVYDLLKDMPNVTLWPYAIGGNDRQATLYACDTEHATLWERDGPHEQCTVVSMNHWFVYNRVGEIDLLHLDCEGAEFEILEQMLDTGRVPQVRWMMVHWHGQDERKAAICERLAQTHRVMWNRDDVEAWERKAERCN